jgi:hypothetical protein
VNRSNDALPDGTVILGLIGGAEGDRTPDLMNAIHALSQLSYGPLVCRPLNPA